VGVLSDYIKKEISKGFSLDKIKAKLVSAGHDVKLVENEIKKFEKREVKMILKANFFRQLFPNKNNAMVYYVSAAIVLIIIVIQIAPNFKKDICLGAGDNCYARLAMNENNAKYCLKINDNIINQPCSQKLWQVNECVYMQRTGFNQSEIDECQRRAFVRSLG
jgi:hypothetical protein